MRFVINACLTSLPLVCFFLCVLVNSECSVDFFPRIPRKSSSIPKQLIFIDCKLLLCHDHRLPRQPFYHREEHVLPKPELFKSARYDSYRHRRRRFVSGIRRRNYSRPDTTLDASNRHWKFYIIYMALLHKLRPFMIFHICLLR